MMEGREVRERDTHTSLVIEGEREERRYSPSLCCLCEVSRFDCIPSIWYDKSSTHYTTQAAAEPPTLAYMNNEYRIEPSQEFNIFHSERVNSKQCRDEVIDQ